MKNKSIVVKRAKYDIDYTIFEGDGIAICHATSKGKSFLVRFFSDPETQKADRSHYKDFVRIGIHVPHLICHDDKMMITILEFIEGKMVSEELANGPLPESYYKQIFAIYRMCRMTGNAIDYMPSSFISNNGTLYYTKRFLFKADSSNALENDALRYWMYSEEFVEYLKSINHPVDTSRILSENEVNKKVVLLSLENW